MKKIIKKWGNCIVITFNPEEAKIYDLEVGDVINFNLKHTEKEDLENIKTGNKS